MMKPLRTLLPVALTAIALPASPTWAASAWVDTPSNCTSINCQSESFRGMYQPQEPLVLQLFAVANECLRVQVDFQQSDMEMVLISPAGRIWGDDNAGGDLEPLIKVAPVPSTGWYTLHINNASGAAVSHVVEVNYGRYTLATNPNCTRPTPPLVNDVLSPAVQAAPSWSTDPQTGEVVYDEE